MRTLQIFKITEDMEKEETTMGKPIEKPVKEIEEMEVVKTIIIEEIDRRKETREMTSNSN